MKCLGTLEVVGFQVPSRPPKPRFPATVARLGTVTPLKGKMGRTVPERSESQRCLPITDLSASICAKGIYRQVLFDPRAKARCLDHSEWATIRPRHGTRVPTTGAMIRIERPSGKVFQLDLLFRASKCGGGASTCLSSFVRDTRSPSSVADDYRTDML